MEVNQKSLACLQSWREFQKSDDGKRLFPSLGSLEWFLRQHRHELMGLGVILKIRGQWHVVRPEFDKAMIKLLQSKAILEASGVSNGQP